MNMKELVKEFRFIRYYSKNGTVENTVACSPGTVEKVYKKHRGSRELGKTNPHFCDDCQYTACWDKGKVVRCKDKKLRS